MNKKNCVVWKNPFIFDECNKHHVGKSNTLTVEDIISLIILTLLNQTCWFNEKYHTQKKKKNSTEMLQQKNGISLFSEVEMLKYHLLSSIYLLFVALSNDQQTEKK